MRSLPIMSPMRPTIGVKIEAESRYAVTTQVTVFWDVCMLAWIVGRAGITRDWSSAKAEAPSSSTKNVSR